MTCASCANRIERNLNKLDGVTASVNYATEKATVDFDPGAVTPDDLVAAVEAAGYQAVAARPTSPRPPSREADELAPLRRRLIISRAAVAAGAADRDDPPAAVRQLAVARAPARHARDPVGRVAVPPRRLGEPPARHGDDGHADLASACSPPGCWSLYALFLGDAGMPDMRMSFELIPDSAGSGADEIYLEVGAVVTTFLLAGPLLRGARQAPRRRRPDGAARARRQGRRSWPTARAPRARSSSSRSATASSSAPARRSPPTASSSRARARSTSRC